MGTRDMWGRDVGVRSRECYGKVGGSKFPEEKRHRRLKRSKIYTATF